MNKSNLIAGMAAESGVTKADAEKVLMHSSLRWKKP